MEDTCIRGYWYWGGWEKHTRLLALGWVGETYEATSTGVGGRNKITCTVINICHLLDVPLSMNMLLGNQQITHVHRHECLSAHIVHGQSH